MLLKSQAVRPLFVYGAILQPVAVQVARIVMQRGRDLGPATVNGLLYKLGGYPGMIPGRTAPPVHGRLYALKAEDLEHVFTRFQNQDFQRQMLTADTEEGSKPCWGWVLKARPIYGELLESGRWTG